MRRSSTHARARGHRGGDGGERRQPRGDAGVVGRGSAKGSAQGGGVAAESLWVRAWGRTRRERPLGFSWYNYYLFPFFLSFAFAFRVYDLF